MSDQIYFMKLRVATLQLPERGGKQQTHTHARAHECENQQLPTMPLAKDLLNPSFDFERRQHKKKRLVQSPNSYFMDVKCPGCYKITTVFSHAQTVVLCVGCSTVLCQPTGGKARLTEGCSFRRKQH
ncbi:40S ribosomal protein S27-like [Rhinichthys klamathensis goyatoka]|uniref:40S ribosomal protein S27-like n=1 Tax=Rhinichthys klamathensis goyatoka TaxID=3034132 RepID=UPI0024B619E5|nr:40S ribosomal protein S27-like [Rhinichthys klamathensis goyatoka]